MSTSGKTTIRKDKFGGISNIFAEQDAANAALKEQAATEQLQPTVESIETNVSKGTENKPKASTGKPEKGRGAAKNTAKSKETALDSIFSRPPKSPNKTKSVYLSNANIAFLEEQSKQHNLSFSTVLNQIIDNFRHNI